MTGSCINESTMNVSYSYNERVMVKRKRNCEFLGTIVSYDWTPITELQQEKTLRALNLSQKSTSLLKFFRDFELKQYTVRLSLLNFS